MALVFLDAYTSEKSFRHPKEYYKWYYFLYLTGILAFYSVKNLQNLVNKGFWVTGDEMLHIDFNGDEM